MKASSKFFYVLIDKALRPRVASTQALLFQYLQKHPDSDVKTFFTKEEASKFMDYHFKMNAHLQLERDENEFMAQEEDELTTFDYEPKVQDVVSVANNYMPKKNYYSYEDQGAEKHDDYPTKYSKLPYEKEQKIVSDKVESSYAGKNTEGGTKAGEKQKFNWNAYYFHKEDEASFDKAKRLVNRNETYYVYLTGSSAGNPGPSGVGYVIYSHDFKRLYSNSLYTGLITNDAAEYFAVIFGLKTCGNLGIKNVVVYGDSSTTISQVNKKSEISAKHLWKFYYEVKNLGKSFDSVEFKIVPKEQNTLAEELSKKGIALYKGKKFQNNSSSSNLVEDDA